MRGIFLSDFWGMLGGILGTVIKRECYNLQTTNLNKHSIPSYYGYSVLVITYSSI